MNTHDNNNSLRRSAFEPLEANASGSNAAEISPVEGSSPRQVIRGESLYTPHTNNPNQTALTDWLNITFQFENNFSLVSEFVTMFRDYFGNNFGTLTDRGRGMHGYHHSCVFENGNSMFAYGGESQRGTASLSIGGEGCALITDWHAVTSFLETLNGKITRWDGAIDDFKGDYSVDLAMEWYLSGMFNTGGNKPKMSQAGNWAEPDGTGRTLYIGKRKNGKMLRVYEKGKQLHDPTSPWVRWEVQLNSRDRQIPFEVLTNPRPYIAGAYSCLSWASKEVSRIKTTQKTGAISYQHLVGCAKSSYGKLFDVMCQVEGSPEAVVKKLMVSGKPKRLSLNGMTEMLGNK